MRVKMRNFFWGMMVIIVLASVSFASTGESSLPNVNTQSSQVYDMKTNAKTNPIGIDDKNPTFQWKMKSDLFGFEQKYYQIFVRNNQDIVWNSGKIESDQSINIKYQGESLQASTRYYWYVNVWDKNDNMTVSKVDYFETGLMDSSLSAWNGAQWIGANDYYLDSSSLNIFDYCATVSLADGSEAGVIIGANDQRLANNYMNSYNLSGENYIKFVLDKKANELKVTGVGYPYEGIKDTTYIATLSEMSLGNSVKIKIHVDGSLVNITLNGNEVVFNQINNQKMDEDASEIAFVKNTGGEYNTFPNLNEIGFYVSKGSTATFRDISINYYDPNQESKVGATVFSDEVGATYNIFKSLNPALKVSKHDVSIVADKSDIVTYADPSFGSLPMLRTTFDINKPIQNAQLYITSRGINQFYINGQRISDSYFEPGSSAYEFTIPYNSYDVTNLISSGKNAMGAILSSGWWNDGLTFEPKRYNFWGDKQSLLTQLKITYKDGSIDTFVSNDRQWKYYNDGPYRYASFYQGETYDATKESNIEGWTSSDYDDSLWTDASIITPIEKYSNPKLKANTSDPIENVELLDGKFLKETNKGVNAYIYDMGTNMVGVPKIVLKNTKKGQMVTIRTAEILYPNNKTYRDNGNAGELMVENLRTALSTDHYICKGDSKEIYEPAFTYHGYRYIEISGVTPDQIESVEGNVLSSIHEMSGNYHAQLFDSDLTSLINQLNQNIKRSQYSNFLNIPTDCNQRNERMGWAGDAAIFSKSAYYNADVTNVINHYLGIMNDEVANDGGTHMFAPSYSTSYDTSSAFGTVWDTASIVIIYNQFIQTGNLDLVNDYFDMMNGVIHKNMLKPLDVNFAPHLTSNHGFLADHLALDDTDVCMLNNAYYLRTVEMFSELAEAVGKDDIAKEMKTQYNEGKKEWNQLYVDSNTGLTFVPAILSTSGENMIQNTQASYALPLAFGVASKDNEGVMIKRLEKVISNPSGDFKPNTITTGFIATSTLLPALSAYGVNDVAYEMFEQKDYASWLYPVTQGATSVWERWNSYTEENDFGGNNSMNSFNHYSLGAILEWMYEYQLGISPTLPGYKEFILQPTPDKSYKSLKGGFDSPYGYIESEWSNNNDGQLEEYNCVIPANTTATVYIPFQDNVDLSIKNYTSGKYLGNEYHNGQNAYVFKLSSGAYSFNLNHENLIVKEK